MRQHLPPAATTWALVGDTQLAGFGKWGAFRNLSDPVDKKLADVSASPEAFYLALKPATRLEQTFDETGTNYAAVDLRVAGPKVATYQALVSVKGTVRFALVKSDDAAVVYDEVTVAGTDAFTDTTLVTLRAQVSPAEQSGFLKLVVENPSGSVAAQLRVTWQQAWSSERINGDTGDYTAEKGLRNTGFVRTDANAAVKGEYQWAMNALSVKAAGRLQIPRLEPDPSGLRPLLVGWKNPFGKDVYDLTEGEVYYDVVQRAVLAFQANGWFVLRQPDRVKTDFTGSSFNWAAGTEKNLLYRGTTVFSVTLPTTVADIAPGTVVRVAWHPGGVVSGGIFLTVSFGGSTTVQLSPNQAAEFVFYTEQVGQNLVGRWLVTQANVTTRS